MKLIVCTVLLLFGGLLAVRLEAGPAPASAPALSTPRRVITLEPGAEVYSANMAADGKTAYLGVRMHTVNVWRLLLYCWPHITAGVGALLVLRWVRRLWRRRGRVRREDICGVAVGPDGQSLYTPAAAARASIPGHPRQIGRLGMW